MRFYLPHEPFLKYKKTFYSVNKINSLKKWNREKQFPFLCVIQFIR